MSQVRNLRGSISPGTGKKYPFEMILSVFDIASSTFYDREKGPQVSASSCKRGPKTEQTDEEVVTKIREVLNESPFSGEGHRKVRARLKMKGLQVGRNRTLRLMRENGLLAPTRRRHECSKRAHEGKITTDHPNECWGGDITEVMTLEDGKVSIFDLVDHCTNEILATHVVKKANRFEAVASLHKALREEFGFVDKDVGRGIMLRVDHGSQFTSERYVNETHYLGFELSYSFVGQPECNGVIERWHRTLKEQLLWTRSWKNADEVREAVARFVEVYNREWLIERNGYLSPKGFKAKLKERTAA